MRKKFISGIVALAIIGLVGCGEKPKEESVAGAKPPVESGETVEKPKEDNVDPEKDKDEKAEEEIKEEAQDKGDLLKEKIKKAEFKLYKPNEAVDGIDINTTVKTENKTVLENLEKIIIELENGNFPGCKIEVKELKEVKGKKVLLIDLKDGQKSWYKDYLQGSTGGFITESILVDSFLQPKGTKLIDGVEFVVNGTKETEFNHAPRLSEVNFR